MRSERKTPKILLTQIEDALEERQRQDRRKSHQGLPPDVSQERRRGDRRDNKTTT